MISITDDLEETKKAETILSTYKIKNESQLDDIITGNQDESKANAKDTAHQLILVS